MQLSLVNLNLETEKNAAGKLDPDNDRCSECTLKPAHKAARVQNMK